MTNLQPSELWQYFHEITQIPRPSKKEDQVIAYLERFAKDKNLISKTDKAGNVLICKSASKDRESSPIVVLQAHMDMVCEKNSDIDFNFNTDPIQSYIDGDWVKAKGTTLGADNGIGMSMMLALLASNSISHPGLECLFTVDEETGLSGAFALEKDFLEGKTLINLDSEDDGEIFVGCAGGVDTTVYLPFQSERTPDGYFSFQIIVKGLKGGHSGCDIEKELGNANKILNRFLWMINTLTDLRLHHIDGGNLRNAIAREAYAIGLVPTSFKEELSVRFNQYVAMVENEKKQVEPNIQLDLESTSTPKMVIDKETSDKLLSALYACPHGVIAMSIDMPGLVETSTNLASIKTLSDNTILITTSQRSSVESSKFDIANQVESVFILAGAKITHGEGYPGWKPNLKSDILHIARESYKRLTGKEPKIHAIHAGLECGLFLEKYPHLDMISIGPQMYGVHSPDERLSISSTQSCWKWLVDILASIR